MKKDTNCVKCGVVVEQEKPSPVCAECWRKVPKLIRTEYIAARNELLENKSRALATVQKKQQRLAVATAAFIVWANQAKEEAA